MHTNLKKTYKKGSVRGSFARILQFERLLLSICGEILNEYLLYKDSEVNNIQTVTACEMIQPHIQWLGHQLV